MPLYPIFYLIVTAAGWFMGLANGPLYALLTYVFIYFNIPSKQWWGGLVPDLRWSYSSALVVAVSLFIYRHKIKWDLFEKYTGLRLLLFYLLWMIVTLPISANFDLAFTKVYDFFRYVIVFGFIVAIIDSTEKLRAYLWVILTQIAYLSWTARSYFTGMRLDGVGPGDAGAANELAILLLSFLPFFLVFLLQGKKWEKILAFVCLPITLNCFAMCRSRGGFLGFSTAMLILFLAERVKKVRRTLFILSIATAVGLFFLSDQAFKDRLIGMFTQDSTTASSGRIENWSYGMQMIKDYPLGAGGGAYKYLSTSYLPAKLIEKHVGSRASHNTPLLILTEQGIPGFLIFLLFLFRLATTGFLSKQQIIQLEEQQKAGPDHVLLYMLNNATLAGLSGLLVAGLFTDSLYFEGLYFLCAIFPVTYQIIVRRSKL